MKFQWNVPNALSIFRILLIPVIVWMIIIGSIGSLITAMGLYGLSAITDAIDGMLARKLDQVTEFGAYFDPLADKILVLTLFVVFALIPALEVPLWAVVLIGIRDIIITYIRSEFNRRNITFKTSNLAKSKTAVQMIALAVILIYMFITRYLGQNVYGLIYETNNIEFYYYFTWSSLFHQPADLFLKFPKFLTILVCIYTYISAFNYFVTYKNQVMGTINEK